MELIPAIDIRGGRCVRLVQGDYGRETVFSDDPLAVALSWVRQGARWLHVVDLDGAREGHPVNDALVRRIVQESGADVQVAGGVRGAAAIDRWVEAGAARVVLGTLAVEWPDAVAVAVAAHGDRIAVALDVKDGRAAAKGWLETSQMPIAELLGQVVDAGVRHLIYTDISRDGMMSHVDFAALDAVRDALAAAGGHAGLVYSGGVTSITDIIALAQHDLEGVIVGRALYDGSIDLPQALLALATGDGT
ncbi:MAG TPA: 1-(5-phosphoribosyl)-5-[(5-phosphoribosylamino)methylideneamino]imidazole-4-carboxamide isomerase [Dehalococcoidia bacterium]|nr:1-(5-phosphoribosyl)-5-[(5-phosphoribosylamino)methylideneamino]imidazole-4-carboxamide isomerase [Dehalococcoidia bacterium]